MFHRRFALPALIVSASLAFAQDSVVPSSDAGSGGAGGSMITPFGADSRGQQGTGGAGQDLLGGSGMSGAAPAAQEAPSFNLSGGYGFANQEVVAGQGMFARPPIQLSITLQQGFDDNIYSTSGKPTIIPASVVERPSGPFVVHDVTNEQAIPATFPVKGSLVTQGTVDVEFLLARSRAVASLGIHVGGGYYWDRQGDPFDPSGGIDLLFAYKLTPRMQFSGQLNVQYLSQPNYNLVNAPTQPGSGDYINLSSKFDLTYQWTARFGTTTTLSLSGMNYMESISQQNNFLQTTVGESVNYRLGPRTTGVLEVRAGQTSYKSGLGDSSSEFLLGGFDFMFSQRFTGTLRVGEEYRSYAEADMQTAATPYLESNLIYGYGKASSLNWTNRFGFEENSTNTSQRQQTFRSGLSVNQVLSAKLRLSLGLNFNHSTYTTITGPQATAGTSQRAQENVSASLGFQYQATRTVSIFGSYTHTRIMTDEEWTTYSKNTTFLGVTYQF